MNCIPEEIAMLYVESELAAEEIQTVEAHPAECSACTELVGTLRAENVVLTSALRESVPNRRLRTLAHLAGSIAASATIAVPAQWAASMIQEAGMWANHVASMPFELAFRAARAIAPLALLLVVTQMTALAMTRRSNQQALVIGREEVIQDSVFATGETVLVEGKIEGTLFMFGRSLEIRGEVDGDEFAGGQEIRITGKVNGNIIGGAETITVRGLVTGGVYAAGRNVHVDSGGQVQREVISGSQTVTVDGKIGRGLTSGASTAMIGGTIERGISFSGKRFSSGLLGESTEASARRSGQERLPDGPGRGAVRQAGHQDPRTSAGKRLGGDHPLGGRGPGRGILRRMVTARGVSRILWRRGAVRT